MTDTVYDKITIARIGLLMRHPFFGNMATRLKIVDGSDWCSTAATNGREIFYNREFFETKTNKEIEFIIAHEIWHNVLDHINRLEGRNPKVWNAAIDYATNGMLIRDRIGEKPKGIEIYHDVKHNGKSAEEIYDEIYEDENNEYEFNFQDGYYLNGFDKISFDISMTYNNSLFGKAYYNYNNKTIDIEQYNLPYKIKSGTYSLVEEDKTKELDGFYSKKIKYTSLAEKELIATFCNGNKYIYLIDGNSAEFVDYNNNNGAPQKIKYSYKNNTGYYNENDADEEDE